MEKLELKASIEALIYNWLKFDTETIDIASGMREETNFYVNERTNGFRVVMEYPIGYNDVQGGDIGEIVGVMEYDSEFVFKHQGKWYFAKEGYVEPFHKSVRGNYFVEQKHDASVDCVPQCNGEQS